MNTLTFTGRRLVGLSREIDCSCLVRNELNGWRRRSEIVTTRGQTVPHDLPYQPRQFPAGTWEITRIVDMESGTEYWPYYIDTSAKQELQTWDIDGGVYTQPNGTIIGRGYGIHHARYLREGEWVRSNTTLGCINVHDPEDMELIARELYSWLAFRKPVHLYVPRWEEWES